MGWEVYRTERRYRDPNQQQGGFLEPLPDFLPRDNELLRQTMKSRGWELTVTEAPPDIKNNKGRTFMASYNRQEKTFQTTEAYEHSAVCVAALKAHGFQISNDQ